MKLLVSYRGLLLVLVVGFFCGCGSQSQTDWSLEENWYASVDSVDSSFVDVFYVASTDIVASFDEDSNEVYTAVMDSLEKEEMKPELVFVRESLFRDSLNFFAPYYHQFTLNAVNLSKDELEVIKKKVEKDVCSAFDNFITQRNGGRKFILAGFSQGAMMVKEILRHMDDKTYQRMVAAYVIGNGLSAEDLICQRIKPARSVFDTGVCISFNSVADTSSIWELVHEESVACINPVNWCTDSTESVISYKGKILTIKKDLDKQVLVVKGFEKEPLPFAEPWPEGCLHHYDILFYNPYLAHNIQMRIVSSRHQEP